MIDKNQPSGYTTQFYLCLHFDEVEDLTSAFHTSNVSITPYIGQPRFEISLDIFIGE